MSDKLLFKGKITTKYSSFVPQLSTRNYLITILHDYRCFWIPRRVMYSRRLFAGISAKTCCCCSFKSLADYYLLASSGGLCYRSLKWPVLLHKGITFFFLKSYFQLLDTSVAKQFVSEVCNNRKEVKISVENDNNKLATSNNGEKSARSTVESEQSLSFVLHVYWLLF